MRSRNMCSRKTLAVIMVSLGCVLASMQPAYAGSNPTTTTLSVSSNSVAAGTAITLTATVTGRNSPVTKGQVTFCDAAAAHCDGAAVFGVAELTSTSTAAIKLTLGAGSYSIEAVYAGAHGAGGIGSSTSTPQAITVTGTASYVSGTTIEESGSAGNYTLTGTVTAFGKPAPTGTVSFLDTSNSNAVVGLAALDAGTLGRVFNPAPGSPLVSEDAVQFAVTGDFNNDGIPDLAVLNDEYSGTAAIFLGNGDGTFQTPVSYGVGQYPNTLAVADVNGDGALDLINTNNTTNTVGISLGNGDGTFQAQTTFGTGNDPDFAAIGDLNNDGFLDLAVPNAGDNTVSILLGNGDGTFQAQATYAVGSDPQGVTIGDFNQDGFQDLAVSNIADGTVSILLGNGDGTFQAQQVVSLPDFALPIWLTSGDLRRNGILDLVVPDVNTPNVYVLLGNGDGTFQAAVAYTVAASPFGVSLGDVNGDGILDLVVPDTGGCECTRGSRHASTSKPPSPFGFVSVLLGNGDGTFAVKTDYPVGNQPNFVALADFNGDGLLDIATSDIGSSTASILLQAQTETATATGIAVYGIGTHNVLASYPGDSSHASSQSSTVPLTGTAPTSTTTALSAAPNPAIAGQSVTLTATVTPAPTGSSFGTVSFYNGATLLGSGNVNSSGVATFSTSSLPAGSDSLTAVYSGNGGFATSTSSIFTEVITPLTTTTTALTAAPNPAIVGQTVTLTATVSPTPRGLTLSGRTLSGRTLSGLTPGEGLGTVSFYYGETLLGSGNVNSSGVATSTTTALPVGADGLTAVYSGDPDFAGSTSSVFTETITEVTSTTTELIATPNPASVGQSVTLTATVTPTPGRRAPEEGLGTVSFYHGETLLGTGNVNSSGVATSTTTTLPVGADGLTALYSGDPDFAGSTSSVFTETITAVTNTTTALSAAPNPAQAGQSVTLTATVTPAPTGSTLGTISFYDGETLLGSGNVNSSGVATSSTSSLTAGAHSLTAVYSGNTGFAASTSSVFTETITTLTGTATALAAAPNPASLGQAVTLTATVSPAPTGSTLGTISFYDGETLLGSGNVNSSGVATFATTSLAAGAHSLTAVYSGNPGFATSTSSGFTETITAVMSTTTALTGAPNPANAGAAVTLTATVSPSPTGSSLGTVSFYNSETLLGTGSMNSSGVATLTTSSLPTGALSLTAVYAGNAGFAASTSPVLAETVNPAYTVAAPPAPVPVAEGGSVNVDVTVPPLGGAFDSVVTLSASGLPPGATATFNPPTVIPGSAGAPTVMTIQLASSVASAVDKSRKPPYRRLPWAGFVLTIGLCSTGLRGKRFCGKGKRVLAMAVLACTTFTLGGCGGGFLGPPATQPGSFVVTITGTSGSLHASTTVTVVVR